MIEQQPYIWYQLVDASESLGTQQYHVNRGTAASAAQSAATSLRGTLQPCTGCAFLEQRYVLPFVELATPAPVAGVMAQRHGVFVFSTATPDQYAIIAIPGLLNSLLMTTGPGAGVAIDTTMPAVAALVAELTNGTWCNKYGYIITTLEAAYLQVRNAVFVPAWLF